MLVTLNNARKVISEADRFEMYKIRVQKTLAEISKDAMLQLTLGELYYDLLGLTEPYMDGDISKFLFDMTDSLLHKYEVIKRTMKIQRFN